MAHLCGLLLVFCILIISGVESVSSRKWNRFYSPGKEPNLAFGDEDIMGESGFGGSRMLQQYIRLRSAKLEGDVIKSNDGEHSLLISEDKSSESNLGNSELTSYGSKHTVASDAHPETSEDVASSATLQKDASAKEADTTVKNVEPEDSSSSKDGTSSTSTTEGTVPKSSVPEAMTKDADSTKEVTKSETGKTGASVTPVNDTTTPKVASETDKILISTSPEILVSVTTSNEVSFTTTASSPAPGSTKDVDSHNITQSDVSTTGKTTGDARESSTGIMTPTEPVSQPETESTAPSTGSTEVILSSSTTQPDIASSTDKTTNVASEATTIGLKTSVDPVSQSNTEIASTLSGSTEDIVSSSTTQSDVSTSEDKTTNGASETTTIGLKTPVDPVSQSNTETTSTLSGSTEDNVTSSVTQSDVSSSTYKTTVEDIETTTGSSEPTKPNWNRIKVAVSVLFVVVTVMALGVLGTYIIRARRETVHYDELRLLP